MPWPFAVAGADTRAADTMHVDPPTRDQSAILIAKPEVDLAGIDALAHGEIRGVEVPYIRAGAGVLALRLAIGEDPFAFGETGAFGSERRGFRQVHRRRCVLPQSQR